jgi:ketopantoate hydroxymethyltransferase
MRRDEAEAEWAFARMYAKEVTKIMVDEKMLPEDPKVEKAFTAAVEVLESPMSQAIKLQAARLILDFCKAKPVAKSEVTVKSAEDWLAQVTADHLTKTEVKNEG